MSQQPWSDAEVIAGIRAGDKGAFVRLYDEYSGLIYGMALRVLRDAAAAEDIVQDVFLQLWRNPTSFDEKRGRLGPWLAVLARHKAVDQLRKLKRVAEPVGAASGGAPPAEIPATGALSTENSIQFSADAEKAKVLMARLPSDQRRALEMAFLDGMTHGEIAARTGEPLGTIKSRIRLGLLFLRKELAV